MNLREIWVIVSMFLTPCSEIRTKGSLVSVSVLLPQCFDSWEEAGVWPTTQV